MLKKVKQIKLYEDVALQIEEAIIAGDFNPGDKLPSERELEEILGASRGTIRQSLRTLEQKGILEIKTGVQGGAFVREITPELITKSISLLIRFNYVHPDHIAEFREGVEGILIAELAVHRHEKEDLLELKALFNQFVEIGHKQDIDWDKFYSLEAEMHLVIGKMTKNPLYEATCAILKDSTHRLYDDIPKDEETIKGYIDDWKNIIQYLEEKNAEKMGQLMKEHILKWHEIYKVGSGKFNEQDSIKK